MKILIIGVARSGTTSLLNAFVDLLNLKKFGEPWNKGLYGDRTLPWPYEFPDNSVVKTLVEHLPDNYIGSNEDFFQELTTQFDTVIILGRKNKKDTLISWTYAFEHLKDNPDGWHKPYSPELSNLDLNKYATDLDYIIFLLKRISSRLNIEITWYENLYSGRESKIKSILKLWGINIDYNKFYSYINPKRRYRNGKIPLI